MAGVRGGQPAALLRPHRAEGPSGRPGNVRSTRLISEACSLRTNRYNGRIRRKKRVATGSHSASHVALPNAPPSRAWGQAKFITSGAFSQHHPPQRGLRLLPRAQVSCHSEPTQQQQVQTDVFSSHARKGRFIPVPSKLGSCYEKCYKRTTEQNREKMPHRSRGCRLAALRG